MDVTVQEERRIIVDLLPVVKDVAAPVAVVDSVPSDGLLRCHQPSLTTPPIPRSDGVGSDQRPIPAPLAAISAVAS
jgi:hypothetical protein